MGLSTEAKHKGIHLSQNDYGGKKAKPPEAQQK
jgi:hypothetical protein